MGVGRVNMTVHLNDAVVEAQVLGYEPSDVDAVLFFPFQLDRLRLDRLPTGLTAPGVGVASLLPALEQRGAPLLPPLFVLFFCHFLRPPFFKSLLPQAGENVYLRPEIAASLIRLVRSATLSRKIAACTTFLIFFCNSKGRYP